jgi:hypothetical protein
MPEVRRSPGRIAFPALFLLAVLLVIGFSFTLGATARTFPLIVAVPTCLLLLFQLWHDIWPHLGERVPFLREQPIVDIDLPEEFSDAAEGQLPGGRHVEGLSEARVMIWLAGLTAAVYFAHYLIAAPLFLLAFLRLQARTSWIATLAVSAAVWAVLYLLFYELLRVDYL